MKLYFSPGACSLSPHIVLREAGLPFTLEKVDLRSKVTSDGTDYTSINPKGYVPALDTGSGTVLTEGPAIVQYLADLVPGAKLAPPAGTMERYRVVEWLNFISTELHKSFSPLFNADAGDDIKDNARKHLAKRLGYVNSVLKDREYLTGSQFTVADAYLFVIGNWAFHLKMDMSDYPHIKAFQQRVSVRPAVQDALRAEGLID